MKLQSLLFSAILLLPVLLSSQEFYRVGSTENLDTIPQFGVLLAGGATDNDDGMEWLARKANGGDVVVLRASGSDGYNNYILSELGVSINSVTSIVIIGSDQANDPEVCQAVEDAEMIFIAGGNQKYYYNEWKGTCLQQKINAHVNEKNAPIGGTSAGLAVLGEVVYTAQNSSVTSDQALGNPYHNNITLANDFLNVPFLEDVVTDSHYNNPDRRGRHTVFMARMNKDWEMNAKGIGINEYTAVGVDAEGIAHIFGNPNYSDFAYFSKIVTSPELCESGQPLHWDNNGEALIVYRVKGNRDGSNTFDLNTWQTGQGGDWFYWSVDSGNLQTVEATQLNASSSDFNDPGNFLQLSPNPVVTNLFVSSNHGGSFSGYAIYDVSGRLVKDHNEIIYQPFNIEFSGYLPGIYFLEIRDEEDVYTKRIIKKSDY
jgi:cyanophycinase-like exopeptidase